jgi:hypothetical protein
LHAYEDESNCATKDRQIKVEANSSRTGDYSHWPTLFKEPGTYRIVAYVDYFNIAPYQDFEVIEKPVKAKVYVQSPKISNNTVLQSQKPQTYTNNPDMQPTSQPSTPGLTAYSVSTSGNSIQVEYSPTYINVRTVTPAQGCTYEGGRSGTAVEVTFKCPGREIQIQLWLDAGQIRQKIEN